MEDNEYLDNLSKLDKTRIGNMEFRYSSYNQMYEFVCWYPNDLYGKEDDFEEPDHRGMCRSKSISFYSVSKNCFKLKECCYVVAFLDMHADPSESDIRWVGFRPVELELDDFRDFLILVRKVAIALGYKESTCNKIINKLSPRKKKRIDKEKNGKNSLSE